MICTFFYIPYVSLETGKNCRFCYQLLASKIWKVQILIVSIYLQTTNKPYDGSPILKYKFQSQNYQGKWNIVNFINLASFSWQYMSVASVLWYKYGDASFNIPLAKYQLIAPYQLHRIKLWTDKVGISLAPISLIFLKLFKPS